MFIVIPVSFLPISTFSATEDKVTARDGTCLAYDSGVVYDKKTGLEWIGGPDESTSWYQPKKEVESLTVVGGEWRMPTKKELRTLYKKGVDTRNMTPLLKNTGWWVWSSEPEGSSSAWFSGFEIWYDRGSSRNFLMNLVPLLESSPSTLRIINHFFKNPCSMCEIFSYHQERIGQICLELSVRYYWHKIC